MLRFDAAKRKKLCKPRLTGSKRLKVCSAQSINWRFKEKAKLGRSSKAKPALLQVLPTSSGTVTLRSRTTELVTDAKERVT